MSTVSIAFSASRPRIGVCPDPNRPPILLEDVVDINLSTEVQLKKKGSGSETLPVRRLLSTIDAVVTRETNEVVKNAEQTQPSFTKSKLNPSPQNDLTADELVVVFAGYLTELARKLRSSAEVVAVTMGSVDQMILVVPPDVSAETRSRISEVNGFLDDINVVIVPYHASVMLYYGENGQIPSRPFIDLQWESDLRVGKRSFPAGDANDMAYLGEDCVFADANMQKWRRAIEAWLLGCLEEEVQNNLDWSKSREIEFRNWCEMTSDKLLTAVLDEERSFRLVFGDWTNDIDEKTMAELRAMLLVGTSNFTNAALLDQGATDKKTAVISHGSMCSKPAIQNMIQRECSRLKLADLASDTDKRAALGAFQLVEKPPCVPYDCGILVRPVGEHEGIGTLVLLRGATADTKAISKTFSLPERESRNIEVLFYTRQVDFESFDVAYSFAEKDIRFAPAHDDTGKTNFYATMELKTDSEGRVDAVRTVLHDNVCNKSYKFPVLPFTGGSSESATIQRGKVDKDAKDWLVRIGNVPDADKSRTLEEWRRLLDLGILTRDQYIIHIFGIEGLISRAHLLDPTCAPEDVQKEGREYLHGRMKTIAESVGGNHVQAWVNSHPQPERNQELAREFKNSVFQDAVGDNHMLDQAATIADRYGNVCANPKALNVDWSKSNLPNLLGE